MVDHILGDLNMQDSLQLIEDKVFSLVEELTQLRQKCHCLQIENESLRTDSEGDDSRLENILSLLDSATDASDASSEQNTDDKELS